jgi:hypothetical protein
MLPLYRGTAMTRAAFDLYTASKGKVITLPAFTSFSKDPTVAARFPNEHDLRPGECKACIILDSIKRPLLGGCATTRFLAD